MVVQCQPLCPLICKMGADTLNQLFSYELSCVSTNFGSRVAVAKAQVVYPYTEVSLPLLLRLQAKTETVEQVRQLIICQ